MKVITIIGARPQFIKAGVVSREISKRNDVHEIIVHTGQHYDKEMSEIFFQELNIPIPHLNLSVGSGLHGVQTGKMLPKIEEVLIHEKPDWVLLYGDTNSTVAGALAAAKLNIKIAHVEAGLRSFNMEMPEEINRIITDHVSTVLLAPTKNACDILANEGLSKRTVFVGDVMYDSMKYYSGIAETKSRIMDDINSDFYLATLHRPQNTDVKENLLEIFKAFNDLSNKVVIPMHPRTSNKIMDMDLPMENLQIITPVGYLDMITLIKNCKKVLTDSGGLQKEAFFMEKQCVTMRTETEWIETLENNWNVITGADYNKILEGVELERSNESIPDLFGKGDAGIRIIEEMVSRR